MRKLVGVLALQGGFGLHLARVRELGAGGREVRDPGDLEGLDGLLLPGGESTVIGLLLGRRGLAEPLKAALAAGLPALGTCAGAILLASDIRVSGGPSDQFRLGLMDLEVGRNAYGSQVDSFEEPVDLDPSVAPGPVPGVFIRAPRFLRTGPAVQVLGRLRGDPVLVRQGTLAAAAFHPELGDSLAVHRWFLETMVPGR